MKLNLDQRARPAMELTVSCAEILWDVAREGDLFASIPIVGTAIQVVKAMDSLRERMSAIKMHHFLWPIQELSDEQRAAAIDHLKTDADVVKVGEVLLLTLDKFSDLDKARLLGQVYRAYAENKVNSVDLLRIARAIDMAFFDDLRAFILADLEDLEEAKSYVLQNLFETGTGLVTAQVIAPLSEKPTRYSPTSVGEKLRQLFESQRRQGPEAFC